MDEKQLFNTKSFGIYQLKLECDYIFRGYDFALEHGFKVTDYNLIYTHEYSGKTSAESVDNIYKLFNTDRPADFHGHSLSMSDIVVINDGSKVSAFYVDEFTYLELDSFIEDRKNYNEALRLWNDLGNIPVDDDDGIETAWEDFPAGTNKIEIWEWFEEKFNISVAVDLMHMK